MADLSELYKSIAASAPDPLGWQKGLAGQYQLQSEELALQEKRRQIAEEQRLRELFQRNQSPTAAELGAISPSFMQQYGKNQFDMMKQQMDMLKNQTDIGGLVNKMAAGALGANADQYDADVSSGMSEQVALEKFHVANGAAIKRLQDMGLPIPQGMYDPKEITPEAGHRGAQAAGIMTNRTATESEQKRAAASAYGRGTVERQLGPMPSYAQQKGDVEMTQWGPMYKPPVPTMQPAEIPQSAQQMPLGDADDAALKQLYPTLPTGPLKDEVGKYLASKTSATTPARPAAMPPAQFVTPQQIQQNKIDTAAAETAAKEKAKIEIEKEADAEEKLGLMASLPNDNEVLRLLQESITGAPEAIFKGPVASALHIENKAQTASTVLQSLAQTVKNLATKAKGDLNQQEVKDYNAAMGAIDNEDVTPMARFAAYTTAKGIIQRKLTQQYPSIAEKYQLSSAQTPVTNAPTMTPSQQALGEAYRAGNITADEFKRQWAALGAK